MDVAPLYVEKIIHPLKAKRNGKGWYAQCPCHEDSTPSLTIGLGEAGRIVMHCFAGCPTEEIVKRIGLSMADLFPPDEHGKILATFDYFNESGEFAYQVVRRHPKKFSQRTKGEGGRWVDSLNGTQRVPYRLPELLASGDEIVFVVEGEKDVETLRSLGLVATCNSGGAGKWSDSFATYFSGRTVVILPDNDEPGRSHAEHVERSLSGIAADVRIVELPGLPPKGDVTDWVNAGGTREQLAEILNAIPAEPAEVIVEDQPDDAWPKEIRGEAFDGPAGKIVRAIEPETEADPVAILVQLLVAFGNLIGRQAFYRVERNDQYTNLFTVLVGRTSRGRKGTSMGWVESIMPLCGDEKWCDERKLHGLSSGEGLIWGVRDRIQKIERDKKTGKEDLVTLDEGERDKRMLVVEQEFASVLIVASREGNILSTIIRQAWDSGHLRILTKNSQARATGAHISIIGHVTKAELRRKMKEVDVENGLFNRFLWVCVRRSKLLPFGGGGIDLMRFRPDFELAAEFGRKATFIDMDAEARELWRSEYVRLSQDVPGPVGVVTDRAAPQVLRLAIIYAILDGWGTIHHRHLMSALAVWDYAAASCRYIFGDSTGNHDADEILDALANAGDKGMTKKEISVDVFSRHRSSRRISEAMAHLRDAGMARSEITRTNGRPSERWFAC